MRKVMTNLSTILHRLSEEVRKLLIVDSKKFEVQRLERVPCSSLLLATLEPGHDRQAGNY